MSMSLLLAAVLGLCAAVMKKLWDEVVLRRSTAASSARGPVQTRRVRVGDSSMVRCTDGRAVAYLWPDQVPADQRSLRAIVSKLSDYRG